MSDKLVTYDTMKTTLLERQPQRYAHLCRQCVRWGTDHAAALAQADPREDESTMGLLLLADLRQYFQAVHRDKVASKDLAEWLTLQDERPWAGYGKAAKPITPTQMAWLLKPFGIRSKQLSRPVNAKGYELADCQESFARYLPPDPAAQNEATKQGAEDVR